jgi:hypothetical protein
MWLLLIALLMFVVGVTCLLSSVVVKCSADDKKNLKEWGSAFIGGGVFPLLILMMCLL